MRLMGNKMKTNSLIVVLAVVAIVIALANISVTLFKVSQLTGYATTVTGIVNLSIVQIIDINMSNNTIEWGHGKVDSGQANATLNTNGDGTATVTNGNWSAGTYNPRGFVLDNVGNVNASLTLQAGVSAHNLLGSASSTNEEYLWNISERLTTSCTGANSSTELGVWNATTVAAFEICGQFNYEAARNSLYIDIWLTVPSDSLNVSTDGSNVITDTITAVGTTAY